MDYYDGNTVTAMWNYAQHYAMSDHAFSTTFGPSTPGAINLVSAQTHGVKEFNADGTPATTPAAGDYTVRFPDAHGVGTMTGDPDPVYDDCSNNSHAKSYTLAGMTGRNIGDLLNAKKVSWGWFQGGFTPTTAAAGGAPASCLTTHTNVAGVSSTDYNPHHEPFQYYASTANPHHLPPASAAEIGHDGQANHQYDMSSFDQVVGTDNMPAVSFLKAPNYQDGHAGYSDPLDEQHFIVKEINAIQKSKHWKDTAIVLAYDDSDGWYDHVAAQVKNASNTTDDAAFCTQAAASGVPIAKGYQDRCGPGPRQPLVVISPFAKTNYVDHHQTDQASILRLIEDNWGVGRIGDGSADAWAGSMRGLFSFDESQAPQVILDETNGTVTSVHRAVTRTDLSSTLRREGAPGHPARPLCVRDYLSSLDIRRSASGLPPVWQVGQYCSDVSANDTSRTVSPHSGHGSPVRAWTRMPARLASLSSLAGLPDAVATAPLSVSRRAAYNRSTTSGASEPAMANGLIFATWRISSE